jgi:hypothetical protein
MDQHVDDKRAEAVHVAIALLGALVALGIAALGFLCRYGFADNSPLQWAKFVGLSWFLLFFSLIVRKLPPIRGGTDRWCSWTSHASMTLAALALTALLGVARRATGEAGVAPAAFARGLALVLFGLGGLGFVLACYSVARSARLRDLAVLVAFAGVFSVYGAGASYGNGYQNPLFVEGMCFNYCQIDELYHTSLCNMLRTYGVPSTGLDGLPFLPYHFGSHWLFAQLCNLLDVGVIDFYARGYRVVFVPFGVFSLGLFAASLARGRRRWAGRSDAPPAEANVESDSADRDESGDRSFPSKGRCRAVSPLFWLIVWIGYVSFMP